MQKFKGWFDLNEALAGYVAAGLFGYFTEDVAKSLFGGEFETEPETEIKTPRGAVAKDKRKCAITPLSAYTRHIKQIQNFAHSGDPDKFAQVMMFSPLSAHAKFPEHWDHFPVLMMILKHWFPKDIDYTKLRYAIDSFDDKYHNLKSTINGFKFETIHSIWKQRETLMPELEQLAAKGDDVALIERLVEITGVAPVKAGFMVQLLWGRAGCIDVHNVAIYRAVFPDIASKIKDEKDWKKSRKDIEEYVQLLKELEGRGIGSRQLWDVWVNFVDTMYKAIANEGLGVYGDYGPSLDPDSPEYQALKGKGIMKSGIGGQEKDVEIPIVGGIGGKIWGMGASATHLQTEPEETLKQLYKMYHQKQTGPEEAGSIIYPTRGGKPVDPQLGLGNKPSLMHYFRPAVSASGKKLEVDLDRIKDIIGRRTQKIGKLQAADIAARKARELFGVDPYASIRQRSLFKK